MENEMSPRVKKRKAGGSLRSAILVTGCAFVISALLGCAAPTAQPVLPGAKVVKLLPSKDALDKFYGSDWEETTAPSELPRSEFTVSDKADPARVGPECAKASDDFSAAFHLKDGATVTYDDKETHSAGLAVYRLATVAKATTFVVKFGAIGEACKNLPDHGLVNTQPLKSSISGAVGYGSADGAPGKVFRVLVIRDGDLVITATSNISTAQADKEIQLELDTIAKLASAS